MDFDKDLDLDLDLDQDLARIEDLVTRLMKPNPVFASGANAPVRVDPVSTSHHATAPVIQRLADIPAAPMRWIWPGWIPAGSLTILGGHVGDGKSTAIAAITAALTTGSPLPDGATAPLTNVLFLTAEDDPASVIRPRLDANGADPDRVLVIDAADAGDLRRDPALLREIIETNDIGFLVIDPLSSFLRRADRASEGAVRDGLQPLTAAIAGTGTAAIGVMRIGKNGQAPRAAQRLVGSSSVPAIARSVIMIARANDDEDLPGRALLQVVKGNYALPPKPVAIDIAEDGAVRWLGPAEESIDEAALSATDRRLSRPERADAMDFLREYLADGPERVSNVLYEAKRLDLSEITLRRAKKELGIVSFHKTGAHGSWMWALPDDTAIPAKVRRAKSGEAKKRSAKP